MQRSIGSRSTAMPQSFSLQEPLPFNNSPLLRSSPPGPRQLHIFPSWDQAHNSPVQPCHGKPAGCNDVKIVLPLIAVLNKSTHTLLTAIIHHISVYSTPSDQAGKEAARAYSTSSASTSTTVAELEQLLAKNDLAGFQQTCVSLQTRGSEIPKDVYHYLLKTLGDSPKVFAPLSSESSTFDPLNSAIGILTDMSREANMGRAAVQPDKDTLLLLLKVAGSKECIESQKDHGWESAWLLVDAIRHGRLPAIMSSDQWELPDLNVALDRDLWKGMFECVHAAGSSKRTQDFQRELNTTTYLMADQLSRSHEVEMDDQLWGYVIQVCYIGSTIRILSWKLRTNI